MDSPKESSIESSKHCLEKDVKICIRCGSTNIKIEGEGIICNECNAVLCYAHKKSIELGLTIIVIILSGVSLISKYSSRDLKLFFGKDKN